MSRRIVEAIGVAMVWRWLSEGALEPWRFRSWIFPRNPDFERKAHRADHKKGANR